MRRSNPPWTNKILNTHWAALEARVGPALMPQPDESSLLLRMGLQRAEHLSANTEADALKRQKKIDSIRKAMAKASFKEYGCGHYGCVMPTGTPGTVIKVTTDQTEAAFVAAYLSLPTSQRPVGIVPYRKLLAIRSESHLKRPVFVLWRDEAQHLGSNGIDAWIRTGARDFERDYYAKSFRKVESLISNCLTAARTVRKMTHARARTLITEAAGKMDDAWQLGAPPRGRDKALEVAWYLNVFRQNAEQMTTEPMGNYVGQGLYESFDAGLLLADVHLNNIGMPTGDLLNEIGMTPIITDPGHAIALDDRYAGVQVEEL
jgi:hypothetical protein